MKTAGTTAGNAGADANLAVIRNNTTTRFIFDAEGSAHSDVEWTTFDEYDDVSLLNKLEITTRPDAITSEMGEFLEENRGELENLDIAHFDDRPGHAMVNFTKLSMLLVGAIGQQNVRLQAVEQQLLTN